MTAPRTCRITMRQPPVAVRPNGGGSWRVKHFAVKALRADAKLLARAAWGQQPPMKRAWFRVTWCALGHMAPDPDNIIASVKAILDGCQDAGVVANDRALWPERPEILRHQPKAQVIIEITEELP